MCLTFNPIFRPLRLIYGVALCVAGGMLFGWGAVLLVCLASIDVELKK